ncbi:MAG: response regulator [Bryobacterales bacterium]|nr:response regulator [Bryobacterales bacterium]
MANGNGNSPAFPAAALTPPRDEPFLDGGVPPTVLILDQVEVNRRLLRAMLKSEPYLIREARRAPEALEILAKDKIDLVILDLMMPGMSGPDFCRTIKADRRTQLVPVLMVTNAHGVENEVAGIVSGADEFLTKPLHPAVVRARVRALLRHRAAVDSLEEAESILFALAQAVEQRDPYTAGHCQRLAWYSVSVGMSLGLARRELIALHRGGFLHDIGKIAVPDAILHKKGRLDEREWEVMRSHTCKGESICRPMKSLQAVLPVIRSHHERWDGGGYPDGLKGEEIPLVARILQVADIYDALTTVRPYKPALSPESACETLEKEAAAGWRDPELVQTFCRLQREGSGLLGDPSSTDWPQLEQLGQSLAAVHFPPG